MKTLIAAIMVLSMVGRIEIIKAKIWRNHDVNPNGMIRNFNLIGGWKFVPKDDWHLAENERLTDYPSKGREPGDDSFIKED